MTKAILTCASIEIECGHCGAPIPEPGTGSQFWMLGELSRKAFKVSCPDCGESNQIKVPARIPIDHRRLAD